MPTTGETPGFDAPLAMEGTGVGDEGHAGRAVCTGPAPAGQGWRRSASRGGYGERVAGSASRTGDVPMAPGTGEKRPAVEGVPNFPSQASGAAGEMLPVLPPCSGQTLRESAPNGAAKRVKSLQPAPPPAAGPISLGQVATFSPISPATPARIFDPAGNHILEAHLTSQAANLQMPSSAQTFLRVGGGGGPISAAQVATFSPSATSSPAAVFDPAGNSADIGAHLASQAANLRMASSAQTFLRVGSGAADPKSGQQVAPNPAVALAAAAGGPKMSQDLPADPFDSTFMLSRGPGGQTPHHGPPANGAIPLENGAESASGLGRVDLGGAAGGDDGRAKSQNLGLASLHPLPSTAGGTGPASGTGAPCPGGSPNFGEAAPPAGADQAQGQLPVGCLPLSIRGRATSVVLRCGHLRRPSRVCHAALSPLTGRVKARRLPVKLWDSTRPWLWRGPALATRDMRAVP